MAREPLYKKTEREMLARIEDGRWPVGTRLPNEFVLAEEFGVSQGTMRRALIALENLGHLRRKPGRGTEVVAAEAPPPPAARLLLPDGTEPVLDVHRQAVASRRPTAEEVALFGSGRVHVVERLLVSGSRRAGLEHVAVPQARAPALPRDPPAYLIEILAAAGLVATRIEEAISAEVTSMGDAVTLKCDRHTPLLCLTRIARDTDGAVLARQTLRLALPGLRCIFGH